jgi:hypothetical protein
MYHQEGFVPIPKYIIFIRILSDCAFEEPMDYSIMGGNKDE